MSKAARRQHGEGSVYERTLNGKSRGWAGQINVVKDGHRTRRTVYGPTQDSVIKKMRKLRQQLDERGALPTADMTLGRWLEFWLSDITAEAVKPNTLRSYKTAVRRHIIPAIGEVRLTQLSAQHIRRLHRFNLDAGLSITTVGNAHRILTKALRDAERDDRVTRIATRLVPAPRKQPSVRKNLTAEQAIQVLQAAADTQDAMAARWLIALLYGPRQGECLGLRWSDIGPETIDLAWALQRVPWEHGCNNDCHRKQPRSCPFRYLHIPRGMEYERLDERSNLCLLRPKNRGSIRVLPRIPIVDAALALRRETVEAQRSGYLYDFDLVFCRANGLPLDLKGDWKAWQALLATAGLEPTALHAARHTAATLLLELGVDAKVIASILGHSDVITTRAYQHVDTSLARIALTGLSDRLQLDRS